MHPILVVLVMLLVPWAGHARAEVYRWTDGTGRVHFSDREPPGGARNAQALAPPSAAPPRVDPEQQAAREQGRRLLQVWDEERRLRASADRSAAEAAAELALQCERLAAEMHALRASAYVYRRGDDGGRTFLSEAERTEYAAELVALHDEHCR